MIFYTILNVRTTSSCTFKFLIAGCGTIEQVGGQNFKLKSQIGEIHNKLKWVEF